MISAQWTVEWEHVCKCKLGLASFWGFHDLMAADLYCPSAYLLGLNFSFQVVALGTHTLQDAECGSCAR